jgi:iron-sulfur cluster insertion protein
MPDFSQSIIFTHSAALKVYQLIQEEGNPDLKLRVFISGGGCSGFKYGFKFDETKNDDDLVIAKNLLDEEQASKSVDSEPKEVELLIDSMSYQYLAGAEIDYREDIDGSRFVIRNPNAQTTCGCGSSFSA